MAVPEKYMSMCSFYKYYSGEKVAPFLTIFIGGNHEASNYLQELPFGGWVAPNIYYLGYAGVVNVNGLRIGGISGIFKKMDYFKGRFEKSPYNPQTVRSVYHVRNIDIFRLKQLSGKIDIIMSHDWPTNVTKHGNEGQLIRFKPFFQNDIESGNLGNPFTEELLHILRPNYWFSGHLHCKFAALIDHGDETATKFLALDKCLPKRRFLQIVDISTLKPNDTDNSSSNELKFEYDLEWLTILKLTNHLVNIKNVNSYMPTQHCHNERNNFTPDEEEKQEILSKMSNCLTIPANFTKTVVVYNPLNIDRSKQKPQATLNAQTLEFCKKLEIDDPVQLILLSQNILDSSCSDINLDMSFTPSEGLVSTPVKRISWPLDLPNPKNDSYIKTDAEIDGKFDDDSLTDTNTSFKRTNSTLELPNPKNDSYVKSDAEIDSLTDTNTSFKRTNSTLELTNSSCTEENEENKNKIDPEGEIFFTDVTGKTDTGKKFKRRNMNIYKDDD